jgi:alkanesulfonate monooxygenase SsuD/methylene tetrahydromethanopterin reductase-like flavin-dependent oxidoreductase (luciferase family)
VPERWGLTLPFKGVPLAEHEALVRGAESSGYDDLWTGETSGPDGFTPLALAAAWTERVRLGTGVVNPFTRGPAVLAQHAAALADASGGRFVLGLRASSDVIVERWNETPFERPLSATEHVVARVREGEAAAGRGETEVICRFFCVPGDDALDTARFMFAAYGTVPVYTAFFRGLGWGEAIDPMVEAWRAGDRKLALSLVPDELVRELYVFGDPGAMRERLGEFAARGITTLVLTPVAPPERIPGLIEALAP